MKNLITGSSIALFMLFAICVFLGGCEDDDEITGDAHLKVVNECNLSLTIYFDGTKLGKVAGDESETWDVPSGTHTVKATCYMASDYEDSHTFRDGHTTVIVLDLNIKKGSRQIIQSFDLPQEEI